MKAGAVKSPWGGFDVYVLPDSDEEARAEGWSDEIIAAAPSGAACSAIDGKMYVRRTTWERVLAEFSVLGARH